MPRTAQDASVEAVHELTWTEREHGAADQTAAKRRSTVRAAVVQGVDPALDIRADDRPDLDLAPQLARTCSGTVTVAPSPSTSVVSFGTAFGTSAAARSIAPGAEGAEHDQQLARLQRAKEGDPVERHQGMRRSTGSRCMDARRHARPEPKSRLRGTTRARA